MQVSDSVLEQCPGDFGDVKRTPVTESEEAESSMKGTPGRWYPKGFLEVEHVFRQEETKERSESYRQRQQPCVRE